MTIADQAHILERIFANEPNADLDVLFVGTAISPATAGALAHRIGEAFGIEEIQCPEKYLWSVGPDIVVCHPKPAFEKKPEVTNG